MRQPYLVRLGAFVLGWGLLTAACPSRVATYTAGQVISPTDVTSNEDTIFNYLCNGVDTIDDGAVTSADILDGTILAADLSSNAVASASIVDATIVAADIATDAVATAELLDGTIANVDVSASAAIDFSKLATLTSGNILVGSSGNVTTSVNPSGDVDVSNTGAFTVQANSVALGTDTTGGYAASSSEGGAATTATALAANGANCSAGNYPLGVDTAGAVESCTAAASTATNMVTFTRLAGAGNGTQDIAHGLGVDPIGFYAMCEDGADDAAWGVADDDDDEATMRIQAGGAAFGAVTTDFLQVSDGGGNIMQGDYTSDDATNITLTWTVTASGLDLTCVGLVFAQ